MKIKGFNENELSEKSREALQSETWNQARTAMKTEIQHFTYSPDIQHFAIEKVSKNDNAYGIAWGNVVREYLKTAYSGENAQAEVVSGGVTYKVLKRDSVTSFYDADGHTLFDVENSRLAKDYGFVMKKTECQIVRQIEETGEEADAVSMRTASLADAAAGNIPDLMPEDIEAAKTENEKPAKERAKEKLQDELKTAKEKGLAEPIINYLLKRCDEDNGLAEDVAQKHKTWEKCFSYIYSKARGQAKGNCAAVRDDVVYEWAEDYYHKDDKVEEEKKAKEAAERAKQHKSNEKKQKEDQKKRIERMEKRHEKNGPSKQEKAAELKKQEEQKPKKNSKDMEGQMDLFSLMGM